MNPRNDPRLIERHKHYDNQNLSNNPDFIFNLIEEMENDDSLKEWVHSKFREGNLSFLYHDGQKKIDHIVSSNPNESEYLIFCSRQLGKSFYILCKIIEHCSKPYGKRKPLARVFAPTQKQIDEIVQDNMQIIEALAPPGFIKRTKSENKYYIGVGELRTSMLSRAHIDGKRGGNATKIVTDEGCFADSDSFKNALSKVIGPQLLRSKGKLIHLTTPAPDENHHIHTSILPKCELKNTLVRLTVYDNPQLTDDQIIAAYDLLDSDLDFEREYLVEIVRSEETVCVPEFDKMAENEIVQEIVLPTFRNDLIAIDLGGTKDPHHLLHMFYDFEKAKICVYREASLPINTSSKIVAETGRRLEKNCSKEEPRRITDCAGQTKVDLNNEHNYYVSLPKKGSGSFEAGLNLIRTAVQKREILIDPSCTVLIYQLKFGKLNKHKTDFERSSTLGHCDGLAALSYGIRSIDKSNPIPINYGYSRENHYIKNTSDSSFAWVKQLKGF